MNPQIELFEEKPRIKEPRRLQVIYQPKGRAREYGEWAVNLYTGCTHGCKYCYVPAVYRKSPKEFHSKATPRNDILKKLDKDLELQAAQGITEPLFFCFACDPYQPAEFEYRITRRALELCQDYGRNFNVLTKASILPLRDISLYSNGDKFGMTLVFNKSLDLTEWEPGASAYDDRLNALKTFHKAGIHTWISLEPVIDPRQTIQIIHDTRNFVDEYRVGTINHNSELHHSIDWTSFHSTITDILDHYAVDYYIKEDLRKYERRIA